MADASTGDFFGYTLGNRYSGPDHKTHDDGRLVLIATTNPVKPDSIETVYVLVTPESRTIGKIAGEAWYGSGEDAIVSYERLRAILRNKYASWETEEQSRQHYQGARFWTGDYNLSLQVSGPHRDESAIQKERPFQLVLALSYMASTVAAEKFEQLAKAEISQAEAEAYSEEESRGL